MLPQPRFAPPWLLVGCVAFAGAALPAAEPDISAARILERTKVLSSDAFQGRAPGTAGEELTVAYLEREFRALGLAPGNPDGTCVQTVPLSGITSQPALSFRAGGQTLELTPVNDFVGFTTRTVPHLAAADTDVVFAGYGVVAPEFDWDDYRGVDVRGKTVVVLIGDPPVTGADGQLDPAVFGGRAMTLHARANTKFAAAAARGAAACLIVHEAGPATFPWAVAVSSNGRENLTLRAPDGNAGDVAFRAWLTPESARRLFTAAGQDFAARKAAAVRRGFRAVPLGATASFALANTLRAVDSRNVAALLPGREPGRRAEVVIAVAHWDHLGVNPRLPGDQIFNGAADNAAGVATLLEIAQAFGALPPERRPARSVLFLALTAEEKGLLGARHYTAQPLHPLERTVAAVNIDMVNQFGPTTDLVSVGLGRSTLDAVVEAVAREQGRTIRPHPRPELGSFYRSDQFEFARAGIPVFYTKAGRDYVGQPADFAERMMDAYLANDYHQVTDEVRPDWTFEGAARDAALIFEVMRRLADDTGRPEWNPGSEFRARQDALRRAR